MKNMVAMGKYIGILVIAVLLIAMHFLIIAYSQVIYDEIGSLMRDLEYLHERGVNVSPIVYQLNKAIESYRSGDLESSLSHIHEARALIERYRGEAESIYMSILVMKMVMLIALFSIPLIVYLLLPRVYLYIWFKLHKKWVVRW